MKILEHPCRNTMYKRVHVKIPLEGKRCEECGSVKVLHRHHEDYSKPFEVRILCQRCHLRLHWDGAKIGGHRKQVRSCVICSKDFFPKHTKNNKTCGAQSCQREAKRHNALKRWRNENTGSSGVPAS